MNPAGLVGEQERGRAAQRRADAAGGAAGQPVHPPHPQVGRRGFRLPRIPEQQQQQQQQLLHVAGGEQRRGVARGGQRPSVGSAGLYTPQALAARATIRQPTIRRFVRDTLSALLCFSLSLSPRYLCVATGFVASFLLADNP